MAASGKTKDANEARGVDRQALLDVLERRYDYYSARSVLNEVLALSGLAGRKRYSVAEIDRICEVLRRVGDRVRKPVKAIQALTGQARPIRTRPKAGDDNGVKAQGKPAETAAPEDETVAEKTPKSVKKAGKSPPGRSKTTSSKSRSKQGGKAETKAAAAADAKKSRGRTRGKKSTRRRSTKPKADSEVSEAPKTRKTAKKKAATG